MVFTSSIEKESIKRKFAVYVVIAKGEPDIRLTGGRDTYLQEYSS